jgi:hypothetical protein
MIAEVDSSGWSWHSSLTVADPIDFQEFGGLGLVFEVGARG